MTLVELAKSVGSQFSIDDEGKFHINDDTDLDRFAGKIQALIEETIAPGSTGIII